MSSAVIKIQHGYCTEAVDEATDIVCKKSPKQVYCFLHYFTLFCHLFSTLSCAHFECLGLYFKTGGVKDPKECTFISYREVTSNNFSPTPTNLQLPTTTTKTKLLKLHRQLSPPTKKPAKKANSKMTDSPTPKTHIAQTLLARAHSPESATTQFTEKIKQRPLYLRPTESTATDTRTRRRLHRLRKKEYFLKHQKPRPLSAREKRTSGLHDLPKDECKYAIFKGLHELWVGYMHELLDLKPGAHGGPVSALVHGSKLVSADYHGAEVEVVRSSCAGRVGVKGIVVRDTKFTFVLVTEGDEMKSELCFYLWQGGICGTDKFYSYSERADYLSIYDSFAGEG